MQHRATLVALVVALTWTAVASGQPDDARRPIEPPLCAGCVLRVPPGADDRPRPLLVALHGDGGAMLPLVRAWQKATDRAGVIFFAPRCPRELGCTTQSFWKWLGGPGHDPRWLGGLIDAIAARHAIDPTRVYATGYSGGATYLGWYVPKHPDRFAAVAHVAGGAPWGVPCPACKVPVLFVLGATDPMIVPYTAPLRRYYDACGGHEVAWETLPGVTHESILGNLQAGRAETILSWLLARPSACRALRPGDAGAVDAGAPDAGAADVSALDAGAADAPSAASPAHEAADGGADPRRRDVPRVPPGSGCACDLGTTAPRGTLPLFALVAIALARRRGRALRCAGDARLRRAAPRDPGDGDRRYVRLRRVLHRCAVGRPARDGGRGPAA
jgi:predicted esterase